MRRTFITKMQDRPGAFLPAVRAISDAGVNITRVSYNKSVDTTTLFIDVSGNEKAVAEAEEKLAALGYLSSGKDANVILLEFKLRDTPGSLAPVLEIIDKYHFNISYINSQGNNSEFQYFKMGLFIDRPDAVKSFLDEASRICEIRIVDYDKTEKNLDNTVFYISFANEIAEELNLGRSNINSLIADSNLIMQILDEKNEPPQKTFEYIGKFAECLAEGRGSGFAARVTRKDFDDFNMLLIEPPCGSNTYIIEKNGRLLFVDCGFALYREEMLRLITMYYPDFNMLPKECVITHADIDHGGLLDLFDRVYISATSFENYVLENKGEDNFRERNRLHAPYSRISKILSDYKCPPLDILTVHDTAAPDYTVPLSPTGSLDFEGIHFDIFEGAGGHAKGEVVLLCEQYKVVFTGDIFVNPKGFTPEQAKFNLLAPYLMTSVNMDSKTAAKEREALLTMINGRGFMICPGHGAITDFTS